MTETIGLIANYNWPDKSFHHWVLMSDLDNGVYELAEWVSNSIEFDILGE